MQDAFPSLPIFSSPRLLDDGTANRGGNSSVMSIYQTKLLGHHRNVTVVWSKTIVNHSVSIAIENSQSEEQSSCKIELKPWPFSSKKGLKSLEVDQKKVEIFWDLRFAKFSSGSEPTSDFYVAVVCEAEVVLLLGDCNKEAFARTKSRPSLVDAVLVSKRENICGKRSFTTRANFGNGHKSHDITVENSVSEMWISVDGKVLIHVTNLKWKFRGNETILVDKLPVKVCWDVYSWLFSAPGSAHGLFMFKIGGPELWRQVVFFKSFDV
ncbi:hypothetical protein H6P81_008480 [Aristolochia fimbriata]|uniref:Uncharacterized protein n=1 Tax=Aristolochia fimbriata TaxID=158543 RepID=A0AAV7EI40_ARIFI|nr:hypothetical protein H6P81_008480 [Aristolochia fimbriata]